MQQKQEHYLRAASATFLVGCTQCVRDPFQMPDAQLCLLRWKVDNQKHFRKPTCLHD